jgi:ubiquinone/menaquinone biosynthesis C-methylase UbiE
MAENIFFRILSGLGLVPDMKRLAKHARKPSGFWGRRLAKRMNQSNAMLYDFVLDVMKPAEGDAILEIGFGNGNTFSKLFDACSNIQVTGLDFSASMVSEARKHNRTLINEGKLVLEQGSSASMPFPDNHFDKVFSINVMYFWDTPEEHLSEVHRVLKPGGVFYPVIRTKDSMLIVPFTQYGFVLKEAEEWKSILEQSGFNVDLEYIAEPLLEFEGKEIQLESVCLVATVNS